MKDSATFLLFMSPKYYWRFLKMLGYYVVYFLFKNKSKWYTEWLLIQLLLADSLPISTHYNHWSKILTCWMQIMFFLSWTNPSFINIDICRRILGWIWIRHTWCWCRYCNTCYQHDLIYVLICRFATIFSVINVLSKLLKSMQWI